MIRGPPPPSPGRRPGWAVVPLLLVVAAEGLRSHANVAAPGRGAVPTGVHLAAAAWVLVFAVSLLIVLMLSLLIKRRRVWYRLRPVPPTAPGPDHRVGPGAECTAVGVGGLARTDQAGYGEEFTTLARLADPPGMTTVGSTP